MGTTKDRDISGMVFLGGVLVMHVSGASDIDIDGWGSSWICISWNIMDMMDMMKLQHDLFTGLIIGVGSGIGCGKPVPSKQLSSLIARYVCICLVAGFLVTWPFFVGGGGFSLLPKTLASYVCSLSPSLLFFKKKKKRETIERK